VLAHISWWIDARFDSSGVCGSDLGVCLSTWFEDSRIGVNYVIVMSISAATRLRVVFRCLVEGSSELDGGTWKCVMNWA
jgi:hypothetical protein